MTRPTTTPTPRLCSAATVMASQTFCFASFRLASLRSAHRSLPLRYNTLHPRRLQLPHLLLERRHLAVAVQWPPVVLPQTPNHVAARRLHGLGERAGHLALPLLETRPQTGDLFADGGGCC